MFENNPNFRITLFQSLLRIDEKLFLRIFLRFNGMVLIIHIINNQWAWPANNTLYLIYLKNAQSFKILVLVYFYIYLFNVFFMILILTIYQRIAQTLVLKLVLSFCWIPLKWCTRSVCVQNLLFSHLFNRYINHNWI